MREAIRSKAAAFENVRIFSQDETRYGMLGVVSGRITLPGIKPVAKIDPRYESVYLYGAADCFQIFLNQFSDAFPESLNLLVLDNGRFHHAKSLEIPNTNSD